jgi:NitT/TauT family transport system permease protein
MRTDEPGTLAHPLVTAEGDALQRVRLPEGEAREGVGRRMLSMSAAPIAAAGLLIGIWYLLSYVLLSQQQRFLLPPPHQVVQEGFLEWDNLKRVIFGTWATTQVALLGLAIAIVVGMFLAIVMAQGRWLERSIYPYAVVVQTIPIIALVPLIGFLFKYDFKSRVIACVMIALFPIITNTLFGLKSADRSLHDLFTLHGASRLTRLRKLELPGALPAIFTGFRISAGLSVIGAIVGDFFFRVGEQGIGRLIDVYRAQLAAEQMFTAIFFSSLLGVSVFWFFGYLGNRVTRSWHESAQERRGAGPRRSGREVTT